MKLKNVHLFLFSALLLTVVGCGDGIKIAAVTGSVSTEDGKALDKIMVEFFPTAGGPRSYAETDAQGKFTLMLDDGRQGAVLGSHNIVLRDVGNVPKFVGRKGEDQPVSDGSKPRIAGKYNFPDKSGLTFTVSSGSNDASLKAAAK